MKRKNERQKNSRDICNLNQELVKAISKQLGIFFTGKSKYDIYTNHNLTKHKNRGGISFNPEKIDWDYDYQYDYFNKPFGVSIELYPIILSYKEPDDTDEEIRDNVRYIYTDSYCLGETDTFTIYLPGTPWDELSEGVCRWLSLNELSGDELNMIAIVDETNEYGIYSYDRLSPLEDAQTTFNSYKDSYGYYGNMLSEASTTPEMVEYTGRMYEMSDECLNYIWNLIRYNVDEEKYNEILTEQRVWIAEKEAKAEADREEFGGGTFAPVIYNDTLATLTMERCEELIEYLK